MLAWSCATGFNGAFFKLDSRSLNDDAEIDLVADVKALRASKAMMERKKLMNGGPRC